MRAVSTSPITCAPNVAVPHVQPGTLLKAPPFPTARRWSSPGGLALRPPSTLIPRASDSPHEMPSIPPMDSKQLVSWTHRLMPWPCSPDDIGSVVQVVDPRRGAVLCLDTVLLDLTHLRFGVADFFASRPRPEAAAAVRALVKSRAAAANTWLTTTRNLNGMPSVIPDEQLSTMAGGGRAPRRKKALLLAIAACEKAMEADCQAAPQPAAPHRAGSPSQELAQWLDSPAGLRSLFGALRGNPNAVERVSQIMQMVAVLRGMFGTCETFMSDPNHAKYGAGIAEFMQQQMHSFNDAMRPWHDLIRHPVGSVALTLALQTQRAIEARGILWTSATELQPPPR